MGGVVKGAFNVVKSVVKYGINMVKSVIKNPLPTIATIALGYFAPGFSSFSGLTKMFGQATGELIVNGVGRAAISAANGGKLSSIVAAGITPFFNSPTFSKLVGGIGDGAVGQALKNVTEANQLIDEYNEIEKKATAAYDRANLAETQADYDRDIAEYFSYEKDLNDRANIINQLYVPSINEEKAILEAEYNANKSVIDDYISKVDEVGQLSKNYELGVGKVLAENADFKMTDAIARGNFTEASKFYNEFENLNKTLLDLDPNAIIVSPSIDVSAQTLLKDIYSTSDETLKNQLIAQANLNQQFNDIRTNAPVITRPLEPTEPIQETIPPVIPEVPIPETPVPVEPTPVAPTPVEPTPVTPVVPETPITDDRAPGYGDLPTLPESGIGQPTPSVPTTTTPPTTPSTGTGSNIIDNVIGGAGNLLENAIDKVPTVIENALIGGATNAVVNEILGNEPPTRPTITKPRPPAKADVGTLRPYTGSLFGQSTTPTTPVGGLPTTPPSKVDPSTLTPYTGSLSFLGQTTTPPTNTTTQTPSGGLQSNQTQTPPTKVDVSQLTPVTDTNLLKSLGIA